MFRKRRKVISAQSVKTRDELEALHGRVWTVQDIAREFVITSIIANKVVVRKKADNMVGTLEYQGDLYFDFRPQPGNP